MAKENHNFGGEWTTRKLEIIEKYLNFYSTALYKQPFKTHYVDPFSGSGRIDAQGELIESKPIEGSAIKALKVKHPFYKYHFNEPNKIRRSNLEEIIGDYPDRNVSLTSTDANEMIHTVCSSLRRDRAVFFIDPYGCQLDWSSMVKISKGVGNDVWLWFPTMAVLRQATIERDRIQDSWRERLNKLFGDNGWEEALYTSNVEAGAGSTGDLFGLPEEKNDTREPGSIALDKYVMQKLESLFPYVNEKPMPFLNSRGSTLFNLYFAMSNKSPTAKRLAKRVVDSILK